MCKTLNRETPAAPVTRCTIERRMRAQQAAGAVRGRGKRTTVAATLERMSISLRAWDGMGSTPQSLCEVAHVATTYDKHFTTDATKSWRREREAAYFGGGMGLMLTKPDNRRLWDDEGEKDGRT